MSKHSNISNFHPLKLIVLPGFGVPDEAIKLYESAYGTWKSVWKPTLLELDGSDILYSDPFTRQDYMVTLFHGSLCVGLTCFRRVDLTRAIDIEDSWFKPWPTESLMKIGVTHRHGLAISWVTVHSDYRRSSGLVHLSDLNVSDRMAESMNFFLEDSGIDVAFGVTRNNRSVNKFSQYGGSVTHLSNAVHHGVLVDLTTFYQDGIRDVRSGYPRQAFSMWENRTVFEPQILSISNPEKPLKKIA